MADTVQEQIDNEVCPKKKDIVDSPIKDKKACDEKSEKENGDIIENENGKAEETEVDAKESDDAVCPVKRKSGAGDAPEEKTAEDATPEKKAKLDDADAESNGAEAEVTA